MAVLRGRGVVGVEKYTRGEEANEGGFVKNANLHFWFQRAIILKSCSESVSPDDKFGLALFCFAGMKMTCYTGIVKILRQHRTKLVLKMR